MSIRRRLWLLFVLALTTLAGLGAYVASIYQDTLQQFATVADHRRAVNDAAHHLMVTLQSGVALGGIAARPDTGRDGATALLEFQAIAEHTRRHLDELVTLLGDHQEFQVPSRQLAFDYHALLDALNASARDRGALQALARASERALHDLHQLVAQIDSAGHRQRLLLDEELGTAQHNLLLLLLGGCLILVLLFWLLDRSIGRPAEEATLLANYDPLTGLPNRSLFHDRLKHAISRANRSDEGLALLFFDLDRFKAVNDALGHHVGDLLLQQVGERLRACVRESDTPARLGGDEFAVILESARDENTILPVAQKILDAMQQPFTLGKQQGFVSASIGITRYPQDASHADALLKNADAAMYLAKRRGRACYHFFTEDLNQSARRRLVLENQLRSGLELQQFSLHYQPQVCLRTGALIGAEALLRFRPEDTFIPPDIFIPVLEETGMIQSVGRWVIEQACLFAAELRQRHGRDLRIAVNLSARQLQQPDFVERVADILDRTRLPAHCLEAEITERNLIDAQHGEGPLPALRSLGVRLSIDDFGTGYSSLSYLKRFSVDLLKIDRSFIHDITRDQDDDAVTTAIIALAHELDIEVIAEGVETVEQQAFLLHNRCDCGQGYLFSRPLPADEFRAWIERRYRLIDDYQLDRRP